MQNTEIEEALQQAMEKEETLLNELMKKEKAIEFKEQLTERNRKEYQKIKASRTWKATAPFRVLIPRLRKRLKEQETHISELQFELEETKRSLRSTEERLKIETEKRDHEQLFPMLRQAKASGDMMRLLEQIIELKKKNKVHFANAFKYIASLYKNERRDYRNMIYHKIMSSLPPEEIPEVIVRTVMDKKPISLKQVASFRTSVTMRQRQNQLSGPLPEWLLEHKVASYELIDALNITRPWTDDTTYQSTTIPERENCVIKPVNGAGSRGVYLVHGFHDIIDVKRAKRLNDWNQLTTSVASDLESGWVSDDEWSVEELIYENAEEKTPARDIKCYCFYGEVALILEIIRSPELKYCWWTADGTRLRTGKYDGDLFYGDGITKEEIEQIALLSENIPTPFIRIDMLKGESGLVFGEFTPKPGNYDAFNDEIDQWLGDHFLQAEARLMSDLLSGKRFTTYNEWIMEWKDHLTNTD